MTGRNADFEIVAEAVWTQPAVLGKFLS